MAERAEVANMPPPTPGEQTPVSLPMAGMRRPSPLIGGTPAPRVKRPSLEYQSALDRCVALAYRPHARIGLVTGSQFYARQLGARLGDIAAQLGSTDLAPSPDGRPALRAVIWAEPETDSAERTLEQIAQNLAPGGALGIVTSGRLARRLPEWHQDDMRPADRPLSLPALTAALHRHGFTAQATYGFHGPRSIALGVLGQTFERLGRPELADRCEAWMRATYLEAGLLAAISPVRLVVARRSAGRMQARRGGEGE